MKLTKNTVSIELTSIKGLLQDELIIIIISLKNMRFSNVFSESNYNGMFKSISKS